MIGQNVFAGAFVDRHGHKRADPDWLRSAIRSNESWFVPVWGDRCLAAGEPVRAILLRRPDVESLISDEESVFLGMFNEQPAFAIRIDESMPEPFSDFGQFHDLRYLGSVLPPDEANLAAHARALVIWHKQQKYCGRCGEKTRAESGGNSRTCENGDCGTTFFPRVDPAIIVLVSDGDRCLLGRQEGWPEGRYSTIAGFVEPGESLEECVAREVREEVGIEIDNIKYFGSQPWPFPHSMMIGFQARYVSGDLTLQEEEIIEADWHGPDELPPAPKGGMSIAGWLIEDWLKRVGG